MSRFHWAMRFAAILLTLCHFVMGGDPGPISATITLVNQDGVAMVGAKLFGRARGSWELRITDAHGIARWDFPSSHYGSFEVVPPNNGFESYPGYYAQEFTRFDFPMKNPGRETRIVNATVAVRKILDPVPMRRYTKSHSMPAGDGPWGLDMVIGDWVAPFGAGVVSDVMIGVRGNPAATKTEFDRQFRKEFFDAQGKEIPYKTFNYSIVTSATFPGRNNGIMTVPWSPSEHHWSMFRHPYVAPETGYRTWTEMTRWSEYPYSSSAKDYDLEPFQIFRIRTPATASSVVRSSIDASHPNPKVIYSATQAKPSSFDGALVGKITQRPSWSPGSNYLVFDYYLNPNPNSRSLEFNRKNIDNPEQTWPEGDP